MVTTWEQELTKTMDIIWIGEAGIFCSVYKSLIVLQFKTNKLDASPFLNRGKLSSACLHCIPYCSGRPSDSRTTLIRRKERWTRPVLMRNEHSGIRRKSGKLCFWQHPVSFSLSKQPTQWMKIPSFASWFCGSSGSTCTIKCERRYCESRCSFSAVGFALIRSSVAQHACTYGIPIRQLSRVQWFPCCVEGNGEQRQETEPQQCIQHLWLVMEG